MPLVSTLTLLVIEPSASIVVCAIAWPRLTLGSAAGIFVSGSPLSVDDERVLLGLVAGQQRRSLFFAVGSRYVQPAALLRHRDDRVIEAVVGDLRSTGSPTFVITGYALMPASRSIDVSRIETSRHTPQRDVIVSPALRGV